MNSLQVTETMSSLQIAEITGKRHADVLEAIRKMEKAWLNIAQRNFSLGTYKDANNQDRPCYFLNKTECLYVATKFNDEARAKLVLRWEELETKARQKFQVPTSFREALLLAAQQQEQIEEQQKLLQAQNEQINAMTNEIVVMKRKTDYMDMILSNPATVVTTQIAQDYGMSAKAFNQMLYNFKIQHKVNDQWILYAPYMSQGYVHSKQVVIDLQNGGTKIKYNTEWTQRGRLFLYEELKKRDVLPLIEKYAA